MPIRLLAETARRYKLAIVILFFLALALPSLEASTLTLVYLLLTPEQAVDLVGNVLDKVGWNVSVSDGRVPVIMLGVAAVAVGLLALVRRARIRRQTAVRYGIFEDQTALLLAQFLAMPGWAALREDKTQISNGLVYQAASIAPYFLSVVGIVFSITSTLILIVVSVLYAPLLTPVALVLGVASVLINVRNFRLLRDIGVDKVESRRELLDGVKQVVHGFERIRFDALESTVITKMREVIRRSRAWRTSKQLTRQYVSILSDSFGLLSLAIVVFSGMVFFDVNAATFVVLLLLFNRLRGYIVQIQGDYMVLKENRPAVDLMVALTARLGGYAAGASGTAVVAPTRIDATSAGFAYDGTQVLEDVNLSIEAGDRILVEGPSGEGKSTLLKVLTGYFPPSTGGLEIFDRNGRAALSFDGLRDLLFYSSDDLYVLSGSIREAVDYAGVASDDEIREALRQSLLLEHVDSLPNGLSAQVGENGQNLSLGQRQRLLLTRLFLRKPQLVVLDEATSNIDVETEQEILRNIDRHLDTESILIVVTHRRATTFDFNKVISVGRGRVVVSDGRATSGVSAR